MSTSLAFAWGAIRIGCYRLFKAVTCSADAPNRPQFDLLALGHSNAGKTTLLTTVCHEDTSQISPTNGFSIKALQTPTVIYNVKELGGAEKFRKFWDKYYDGDFDGLVYVIDASATEEAIADTINTLSQVLSHAIFDEVALLVVATKQDIAHALSITDIKNKMDESLYNNRPHCFAQCSSTDAASCHKVFEDFSELYADVPNVP